jgi:SAM-dependent methyltransferase
MPSWSAPLALLLSIKGSYFRLFEWLRVVVLFYTKEPKFAHIDCLLARHYFWKNPHRLSKEFLEKKNEKNIYQYGETPLTSLAKIAKECGITSKDTFFELGCGSGRTCFWLTTFIKCHVVGIDYLPAFIQKAKKIKRQKGIHKVNFQEKNILDVDYSQATCIYLYGTCLEDTVIHQLVHRFSTLSPRTQVITVSYPLTDYAKYFSLKKQFLCRFPWGKAEVYLNEKIPENN